MKSHHGARAVDRVDREGNISEHLTDDGKKTVCGVKLDTTTQPPAGNRKCRNCFPKERP